MILNIWGIEEKSLTTGAANIIWRAWNNISKVEKVIIILSGDKLKVRRQGNEMIILCLKYPRPSRYKWLQRCLTLVFKEIAPQVLLNLDSIIFSISCLIKLWRIIKYSRCIHTYQFWFALFSVFFPSLRKKLIYTELGGEWIEIVKYKVPFIIRFRYLCLARWAFKYIRRVIVQSEINKLMMKLCNVDISRIKVVRHARGDPKMFKPIKEKSESPFKVLYVGRIVPQKGLHILVEAGKILVKDKGYTDIKFIIVGPIGGFGLNSTSEYFNKVKSTIYRYGLNRYFIFKYFVDLNELISLYSSSNIYVLPSFQDAMPSSVVEAMMCGTPVIGTKSGGMMEQIKHGITGFLVEPGDVVGLVNFIEYFLRNRGECIRMGYEARKRAIKLFSIDHFWFELYQAIR